MLFVLRNTLSNLTKMVNLSFSPTTSSFHLFSKTNFVNSPQQIFLKPATQNILPSCGFKVMGKLRKRCKDCYFVRRGDRLFVICNTHPRHKQMSMVKDPKNTWILTHATQSKVRPW